METKSKESDKEWMARVFRPLFVFDPEDAHDYYAGRVPDCTTVARAAEAGCLDFLKWVYEHADWRREFDDVALGYAVKGGHVDVVRWLCSLTEAQNWKVHDDEITWAFLDQIRTKNDCAQLEAWLRSAMVQ